MITKPGQVTFIIDGVGTMVSRIWVTLTSISLRIWVALAVYTAIFLGLFIAFANMSLFDRLNKDFGPLIAALSTFLIVIGIMHWQKHIHSIVLFIIEFVYLNRKHFLAPILMFLLAEVVFSVIIFNCMFEKRAYRNLVVDLEETLDKDPLNPRIGELAAQLLMLYPSRVDVPLILTRKSVSLRRQANALDDAEDDTFRQFNAVLINKMLASSGRTFSFDQKSLKTSFFRRICLCDDWASEYDILPWLVLFTMEARKTSIISGANEAEALMHGFEHSPIRGLLVDLIRLNNAVRDFILELNSTLQSDTKREQAPPSLEPVRAIANQIRDMLKNGEGKRAIVAHSLYQQAYDQLGQLQLWLCDLRRKALINHSPGEEFYTAQAVEDFIRVINTRRESRRRYNPIWLSDPQKLILYTYIRYLFGAKRTIKKDLLGTLETQSNNCPEFLDTLSDAIESDVKNQSFWLDNTTIMEKPPGSPDVRGDQWASWITARGWRW